MKTRNYLLIALIAIIVFGCSTKHNDVTISGIIRGNIPERVFYSYPANETNFWNFTRSVTPDSMGSFTIKILIDKPTFVNIFTKSSPVIIVEPNGKYEVEIDLTSEEETYSINSNLESIQDFYSSLLKINPKTCHFSYGDDISNLDEKVLVFKEKLEFELQKIQEICNNSDVSKELFELISLDREIYYLTAQMVLASRNWSTNTQKTKTIPINVLEVWKDAALSVSLENEKLLRTNFSYDFLDMFLWYKVYSTYELEEFRKLRIDLKERDKSHSHNLELARQFFENGKVLEFYSAGYIHINSFRDSKDLVLNYEEFKNDYPESKYNEFLNSVFEFTVVR